MNLRELRAKYPQYSDMSDDQLARSFHSKFYSDMPFGEFASKIGYEGSQEVNTGGKQDREDYSVVGDTLRSLGTGIRSGLEGIAGTGGDIREMQQAAGGWIAEKLGASPETVETVKKLSGYAGLPGMAQAPTTRDVQGMTEQVIGDRYTPQSDMGEYARSTGEMIGGAITPGGAARKAAMVVAPGVLSEFMGDRAADAAPEFEGAARGAGAIIGGIGAGLGGGGRVAMNKALKKAPTKEFVKEQRDLAYKGLKSANIRYDLGEWNQMTGQLGKKLVEEGFMEADAPKTWARVKKIVSMADRKDKNPHWIEVESIRKRLGEISREIDPATRRPTEEAKAASIVFRMIDDFEKTAGHSYDMPVGNAAAEAWKKSRETAASPFIRGIRQVPGESPFNEMRRTGRDMALRKIKSDIVENRADYAGAYVSGPESGARNQFASLLKSKVGQQLFNPAEQEALMRIAAAGPIRNILNHVGRLGVGAGGTNALLPSLAASGAFSADMGYGSGDPATALGRALMVLGAASAARRGAVRLAAKDIENALGFVRSGPEQQKKILEMMKTADGAHKLAQAIIARNAVTDLNQQPAEVTVTGNMARGN